MKALSIKQPWAWAIVNGYKKVENRSWKTSVTGRILVHAGKKFDMEGYQYIMDHKDELFYQEVNIPKPEEFEKGGIVGAVTITGCFHEDEDHYPDPWFFGPYGFTLKHPVKLDFIPCKGKLKFFKPV